MYTFLIYYTYTSVWWHSSTQQHATGSQHIPWSVAQHKQMHKNLLNAMKCNCPWPQISLPLPNCTLSHTTLGLSGRHSLATAHKDHVRHMQNTVRPPRLLQHLGTMVHSTQQPPGGGGGRQHTRYYFFPFMFYSLVESSTTHATLPRSPHAASPAKHATAPGTEGRAGKGVLLLSPVYLEAQAGMPAKIHTVDAALPHTATVLPASLARLHFTLSARETITAAAAPSGSRGT